MSPTVSVIIPTFGRTEQLSLALQSVLDQVGLPEGSVEIIIVDDGSETPPLISKHLHVTLICREKNGGAAAARNTGIQAASGELIAFLDSDDIWLPTKLANQLASFRDLSKQHNPMLLAVGSGFFNPSRKTGVLQARFPRDADQLETFSSGCWFCPGSSVLLSRASFDRIGLQDQQLRRLEDLDWFIRFGKAGGKYICTDQADVVIYPSGGARIEDVLQSTWRLKEKYGPKSSAPLTAKAWNRLASYLALEKAVACLGNRQIGKGAREFFISLLRRPRLQPALEKFWKQSTNVPDEVETIFRKMIDAKSGKSG